MNIRIFNSLTRRKEELPLPPKGAPIRLFVCGPTVYDHPHIGNARTYMVFDIFVRYVRFLGYRVFYLQNITDIDDKIIARARALKTNWREVSSRFTRAFRQNMRELRVVSVNKYAPATRFIPEIVRQVKTLIFKKNVYLIPDDGYYFNLKTFPEYGKLARRTAEQAEDAVSRIDASDKKKNRGDFCVWKLSSENEPGWRTELGYGRPGWHIEDTAITEHFFGPQYDIHGGGIDLIFPHHEAEIAQQESASGIRPFVKLWMHAGLIRVNGRKMSKSLGNFMTIPELLANTAPDVFRMLVVSAHYRSPLSYENSLRLSAEKNVNDIRIFLTKLKLARGRSGKPKIHAAIRTMENSFAIAMADDLNTPKALAAIFGFISKIQPHIWEISPSDAHSARVALNRVLKSVGFVFKEPIIPAKTKILASNRDKYRRNKQFMQADRLRMEIDRLGYTIEDTPQGPFLWPK